MITEADDGTNLGELTHCTDQLEDVIGAVQTTVNQLNQFLIQATGQGIQLLPNLAGPLQKAILGEIEGNKNELTSLRLISQNDGHIHRKGRAPHQSVEKMCRTNDSRGEPTFHA